MARTRFKVAFIAMSPDADPVKHRSKIVTDIYELTSVLAKDEGEGADVAKELVREEGVQSILLCPGFTNRGVADVASAVGDKVAVSVSRGDGPGGAIARQRMQEAGFFAERR